MRTTAIIATIALLSGCATPPPQVQTVYVPADNAAARKARNGECIVAVNAAFAKADMLLGYLRKCPTMKNNRACLDALSAINLSAETGNVDAATACLEEMNAGGKTEAELLAYSAKAEEISKRLKAYKKQIEG